ncbi:PINc domain-containing protein [Gammaproteobacteria bacterium]
MNLAKEPKQATSMRIYLDMCCLQRPMDDQTHLRIHLEAEAILGILAWCEVGSADLLNSVALNYEVDHNPHPARKAFVQETLLKSNLIIQASYSVEQRARSYTAHGIKVLDALHLACAVEAQANYFCTCDDRFFRRAKQIKTGQTKVVSPLELIEVIAP